MGVSILDGDKMQELINAVWAISGGYNLTDAKSIVAAIRSGNIDKVPNGSVFVEHHEVYGDIYFVTRAKNYHKVVGEPNRPTITIQSMYLLSKNEATAASTFMFDRPEAFYKVTEVIPANTVCKMTLANNYSAWVAGTYNFTPTADIPVGSKLCLSYESNVSLTSLKVVVYADAKAVTPSAEYSISSGDGDATKNLGTFGTELNYPSRILFGSNNDAQSNLFQWLNADSGSAYMDSVFVEKTDFDMMDTSFVSIKGFLGGFSDEFKSYLGLCEIPNITNELYETSPYTANGQKYTYNGYFFMPSRKELYGTVETSSEADEVQFDYYKYIGTTNPDKLMCAKNSILAGNYWLRTPSSGGAHALRACYRVQNGGFTGSGANNTIAVCVCANLA